MMTEMQRHFEEWLKEFRGDSPAKMPASLEYMAWQAWQKAWQASREAIVVSLPDWSCYDTPRQAIEACKDSLTHAGVAHTYD